MPLLHPNESEILLHFYKTVDNKISEAIVKDPHAFFGNSTRIIYITSEYNENSDPIEWDQLKDNDKIKSGSEIRVKDWIYVPYNKNYTYVHNKLQEKFLDQKLDYATFIKDTNYALNYRAQIKAVYNSLPKGINFNSMLIYSGSAIKDYHIIKHFQGKHNIHFYSCSWLILGFWIGHNMNAGCIYTGDADLNAIDLSSIFKKYWNNVGTIQVPHHGDRDSFNKALLKNNQIFIFPVSYGTKNTYGHPSNQTIIDIFENNSIPVFVDENASNIYIQILECA